jgi:hypothetical protein
MPSSLIVGRGQSLELFLYLCEVNIFHTFNFTIERIGLVNGLTLFFWVCFCVFFERVISVCRVTLLRDAVFGECSGLVIFGEL